MPWHYAQNQYMHARSTYARVRPPLPSASHTSNASLRQELLQRLGGAAAATCRAAASPRTRGEGGARHLSRCSRVEPARRSRRVGEQLRARRLPVQLRELEGGLPSVVERCGRRTVREEQRDQRRVPLGRRRVQRRLRPRAARRRPSHEQPLRHTELTCCRRRHKCVLHPRAALAPAGLAPRAARRNEQRGDLLMPAPARYHEGSAAVCVGHAHQVRCLLDKGGGGEA
jgi:hypothetical protein